MASMPTFPGSDPLGLATRHVVVLAFDLLGEEAADLPSLLAKSLSDKNVEDAIQSALNAFMLNRMAEGTGTGVLTANDAHDLLRAVSGWTGGAPADAALKNVQDSTGLGSLGSQIGDAALNRIKDSPGYKQLATALSGFEAALKTSPMGVWVDEHKTLVYVAGIALVVGGAAALFVTKTGGAAFNFAADAVQGQLFKVGTFIVNGKLLAFQPDKRVLGGGLVVTRKFNPLDVSLNIGVVAAGIDVQRVNGHVVLKTSGLNAGAASPDWPGNRNVDLGFSMGFDRGPLKPLKLGLGAMVTGGKVTGDLGISLKTRKAGDFGLQGQISNKQFYGLATWTMHF
jgi:hypothetical protein